MSRQSKQFILIVLCIVFLVPMLACDATSGLEAPTPEHELCHWHHPFWPEWACDAIGRGE